MNTAITNIGWIFREQPLMDVGIDGIIETAIDLEPTGKFIAVQVKSGASYFNGIGNNLSIYISEVHKNYWSSMNLPIILVGYLPEEEHIFWSEVSTKTIKKTPTKWKIEIKKNQTLNHSSVSKLFKLIEEFNYTNNSSVIVNDENELNDVNDLVKKVELLKESTIAVDNMRELMQAMAKHLDTESEKLRQYAKEGKNENDAKASKVLDSIGINLTSTSRKLKTEIHIFAETFGIAVGAYDQIYRLLFDLDKNAENYRNSRASLQTMIDSIEISFTNVASIRKTLEKMRDANAKIRVGKRELLSTLDTIFSEYSSAYEFCVALVK